MQFIKFSSIENSYREEEVYRAKALGINDWIVTEKLHGSNLGIYFSRDEPFRFASRNGFTDDGFFGVASSPVIQELLPKLQALADSFLNNKEIEQFIIYGELVGSGVQKGVFYSKEKSFFAFRISYLIDGDENILNYNLFSSHCDVHNIPIAPFIFRGNLDDCLKVSNAFDSLIANIPDNICEGVVIQPFVYTEYHTGSAVMLKNKNDKFLEKSRIKKEPLSLEMNNDFIANAECYLTENLAESIISKIGRDMSLIPLYMKEFNDEMVREIGAEYDDYKVEKKYIMGRFLNIIKPLLKG